MERDTLTALADPVGDVTVRAAVRGGLACVLVEALATPVVIVDAGGAPLLVNLAAQRYLARRDGLVLRSRIDAIDRESGVALRAAIAAAASGEPGVEPRVVPVARPARLGPLPVIVTPLAAAGFTAPTPMNAALLSFHVPDDPPPLHDDLLARYFGLTRTEASIASRLARGQSLADIAADLGLAVGTVRWHLKKVLPKVEVRSQAELVARILASPLVRLPLRGNRSSR